MSTPRALSKTGETYALVKLFYVNPCRCSKIEQTLKADVLYTLFARRLATLPHPVACTKILVMDGKPLIQCTYC